MHAAMTLVFMKSMCVIHINAVVNTQMNAQINDVSEINCDYTY